MTTPVRCQDLAKDCLTEQEMQRGAQRGWKKKGEIKEVIWEENDKREFYK